jgi:hypothetical protein
VYRRDKPRSPTCRHAPNARPGGCGLGPLCNSTRQYSPYNMRIIAGCCSLPWPATYSVFAQRYGAAAPPSATALLTSSSCPFHCSSSRVSRPSESACTCVTASDNNHHTKHMGIIFVQWRARTTSTESTVSTPTAGVFSGHPCKVRQLPLGCHCNSGASSQ